MERRTVLITGASRGIGRAAALQLAEEGARVVVLCRSEEGGRAVTEEIQAQGGEGHFLVADLRSLSQVREAVREFKERFDALHVLVNNAGVVVPTRRLTEDNLEETFAVNHVAHFVLVVELMGLLEASANASADRRESRIVSVSSQAHHDGYMRWHNLRYKQNFAPYRAYAMSKLAGILFTRELARRLAGTGVTANAMHPGRVATGFGIAPTGWRGVMYNVSQRFLPKAREAARALVHLATSPELEGVSGKYFVKGKVSQVSAFARDEGLSRRIWTISEHLAGIRLMEFAA